MSRDTEMSYAHELSMKYKLSAIDAKELYTLLEDMYSLDFTSSFELSCYIVKNQLGYKYPNISGIVRMSENGREWDFKGGFPTRIYGIVCRELDLGNQQTHAEAVGFRSFKELQKMRR